MPEVIDQAPAPETFNAADVASRHANLFSQPQPGPDLPDGTDLGQLAIEQAKKTETKEEKKDTSIPDEILGKKTEAKQEDDWDSLHKEEVKGQVKNEHFKRYKEVTGKKVEALTSEREAIRKELEELRAKSTNAPDPKEIEHLRTTLKERDDLIARKYVEESPVFKEKFTSRKSTIEGQLTKTLKDLKLDEGLASQLLGASIAKRIEIMENAEINSGSQAYISSLLQQSDQVDTERQAYLSDWQSRKGELEQAEQAKSDAEKAKIKEHEDRIFNKVWEEIERKNDFLKKFDGRDDWNKGTDDIRTEALRFFQGEFQTEEYAELAIAGIAARRLDGMNKQLIGMVKQLQEENASLKSASPTINGHDGKPAERKAGNTFDRNDAAATFRHFRDQAVNGV